MKKADNEFVKRRAFKPVLDRSVSRARFCDLAFRDAPPNDQHRVTIAPEIRRIPG
jgi:hypothetical protein